MNSTTSKLLRKYSKYSNQPYKLVKSVYESGDKKQQAEDLKDINKYIKEHEEQAAKGVSNKNGNSKNV